MILRGAATALLALAFGLLALADARLDRLETRAGRPAWTSGDRTAPHSGIGTPHAGEGAPGPAEPAATGLRTHPEMALLALEIEDAVARLEGDAARRAAASATSPASASEVPPEQRVANAYREELRRAVRAGVLASFAENMARIEHEVAPPGELLPAVGAALLRVLDRLAGQCADRVAGALDSPTSASFAGLENGARAHLRQELARVLGAAELERFDRSDLFRESEGER